MNLALFDFDGTISNRDSFLQFIQQSVGPVRFGASMVMLLPQIIAYKLRIYPNYSLKEDVLRRFFAGCPLDQLQRHAREYEQKTLPGIIRPQAMEKIEWHKSRGDIVVVVSASLEIILEPWCHRNGLALLATRMELFENRVTGSIKGHNCWGKEKVRRVRECYNLDEVDTIYAYGDSKGDQPMLAIATHAFYRPFHE